MANNARFLKRLIIILLCLEVKLAKTEILVQLQTKVSLAGVNVTFICKGHGDCDLDINKTPSADAAKYFNSRGIFWINQIESTNEDGCNAVISQWTIIVNASNQNNNTILKCQFKGSGCRDASTSKLIVVEGPPEPPKAPILTLTNQSTIILTWTAPWLHPITNYTVAVTNTSSGLVSLFTVDEEQFVLKGGVGGGGGGGVGGEGQCDELLFTVEAETDVGSSGTSPITSGGFLKGLSINDVTNSSIYVEKSANILLVKVQNPPNVCLYEKSLTFTYTLSAVSGCTVFNQSVLTPNLTISINKTGVCGENLVYVIVVTMENVIGETVSLNTTIYLAASLTLEEMLPGTATLIDDINSTADMSTSLTLEEMLPVTTALIDDINSTADMSTSFPDPTFNIMAARLQEVLLVSIAVVTTIIISIVVLAIVLLLILLRKHQSKPLNARPPQSMTVNPIYDASDGVYDEVNVPNDYPLKTPDKPEDTPSSLPPPRNTTTNTHKVPLTPTDDPHLPPRYTNAFITRLAPTHNLLNTSLHKESCASPVSPTPNSGPTSPQYAEPFDFIRE